VADIEPDFEWIRKRPQVEWLIWSLEKAHQSVHSDDELLAVLEGGLPNSEREGFLREIQARLEADREAFSGKVLITLETLSERHRRPGPAAQETDRLLRRLLWRLPDGESRALALSCAKSPRLQRRIAAWRFYASHGLDDGARTVVAASASRQLHDHLAMLAVHDADLLDLIGLEEMLVRTADPYWRGRILETWLAAHKPLVGLLDSHPSETLFAIRRADRRDLIDFGYRLFDCNRADPGVAAAAVQLFAALGCSAKLADAQDAGLKIFEEVPEPEKDWLGLNRALERLRGGTVKPPEESSAREAVEHTHSQAALW
jgi:hypothetical protein